MSDFAVGAAKAVGVMLGILFALAVWYSIGYGAYLVAQGFGVQTTDGHLHRVAFGGLFTYPFTLTRNRRQTK